MFHVEQLKRSENTMTREEFNSKASELLANVADTGKVSDILDELRTGFIE